MRSRSGAYRRVFVGSLLLIVSLSAGATPAATEPAEAHVSITAQEADLRGVLMTIAQQAQLEVAIDDDVAGRVTAALDSVPLPAALATLISPTGYEYQLEGNRLRVYGEQLQTRIFTLDYMTGTRFGRSQLSASSGTSTGESGASGESGEEAAQSGSSVNSQVASNPWAQIAAGLETILFGAPGPPPAGARERLVVHPASGVILISAPYAKLNRAAAFLERIAGSIHRQVVIEARIIEVSLSDKFQMGLDWSRIPGAGDDVTSVFGDDEVAVAQALSPGNAIFQIAGSNEHFDLLLDALSGQGQINVISAPRVATLNNQKAIIKAAREESFFSQQVEYEYQPDGTRIPIASVDPERITIGLILDVTPQISAAGGIMMHVHPSLTDLIGVETFPPGATGDAVQANAPVLDIREVDTVVRVDNGEMLVIGGLIKERFSETIEGVPLLSKLPLLGHLFRRTERKTERIELVIVLKPEVVIGEAASRYAAREIERLEGQFHSPAALR